MTADNQGRNWNISSNTNSRGLITCAVLLFYPLVQGPLSYEAQQLVIDQVKILFASVDDGDNDIVTNGFLGVMGTHLQIF